MGPPKRRQSWGLLARAFLVMLVATVLSACAGPDKATDQTSSTVDGNFFGGVATDEPRATLVGRDVLMAGGTAADAAVAIYFTLAVTYPSNASLGAGGACLVQDPDTDDTADTVRALEFLPGVAVGSASANPRRATAVPAAVRGMFALYSRYGRLEWGRLVAPAENLARFGHPISRALARDLSLAEGKLFDDREVRRIFGDTAGLPLVEGQILTQLDLAAVLAQVRIKGPGDFYGGDLARRVAAAATAAGGHLSISDLRAYVPRWTSTISAKIGNNLLHSTQAPLAGGITTLAIAGALNAGDRWLEADADERPHMVAEAGLRAFADRSLWLGLGLGLSAGLSAPYSGERMELAMASYDPARHIPAGQLSPAPEERLEVPAATSFTVVDSFGMAVSCVISMNNLFGTGRIGAGTGIIMAAAPSFDGRGPTPLGPVMLVNPNNGTIFFAAAAVGGAAAPTALATVIRESLIAERPLVDAVRVPRLHHGGAPDRVSIETGVSSDVRRSLERRGHKLVVVSEVGRVNAIHCPGGLPRDAASCSYVSDPRGFGMAVGGRF